MSTRETARLLLARLSPHMTSVGNVGLVAKALEAEYTRAWKALREACNTQVPQKSKYDDKWMQGYSEAIEENIAIADGILKDLK